MIVIGLTGGIGSGKSTVGARLVERGAVLIDADAMAREVVEPGRPAYEKVVERFGDDVVASGRQPRPAGDRRHRLQRSPRLSPISTRSSTPRSERRSRPGSPSESGGDHVVVLDIPLLVEGGSSDRYGFAGVLVVDAPIDLALERLVSLRRMDRADAEARIANQASREERIRQADFVIMNMGTLEELDEMVARAWAWIEGLRAQPSSAPP